MKRRSIKTERTGKPPAISKYDAKRKGLRQTQPPPGAAKAALENRQIAAQVHGDIMSVPKFTL